MEEKPREGGGERDVIGEKPVKKETMGNAGGRGEKPRKREKKRNGGESLKRERSFFFQCRQEFLPL